MDKIQIRTIFLFQFKLGRKAAETARDINDAFGTGTTNKCQIVLFNPLIGSCQVLPPRAWVDLGAIAMKGYSKIHKGLALLEPYHQIV